MTQVFKKVRVTGDWIEGDAVFDAWSDGHTWNGCAEPYFELASAMKLCDAMSNMQYDTASDAFVVHWDGAESETFRSATIRVGSNAVKVYPIGAANWTWNLVESTSASAAATPTPALQAAYDTERERPFYELTVRECVNPILWQNLDAEIAGIEADSHVGRQVVVLLAQLQATIQANPDLEPRFVDDLIGIGLHQARVWYFG